MSNEATASASVAPAAASIKRSVTIASLIMMGSVFVSRILAIVREMVLASYGGTRAEMDAYVAAFLLPEIVNHLLAGGFMSVTFIPIFQKHLAANRRDLAWRAFSNLLTTGSLLIIIVTALGMIFTENVLGIMGEHITDPRQLELTTRMTRIILPGQLFFYWGALLLAVQYAEKRFFFPALAPLVYNAGIIFGGLALSRFWGIEGFAWGVLLGSFIGNFVLQLFGARGSGLSIRLHINLRDPDLIKYALVTIPLVIGLGMQFSNEIFFRYFGSHLGAGGLASLNYGLRTMMALVAVFGQAFGVAAFPFLSQYAAEKRYSEMNSLLFNMIGKVGVVLIPTSLLLLVLSQESLALLFQRGKFTMDSLLATAPVLSMYCIGAFGMAATNMISRGFYALQNTWLPMVVSSLIALASVPLYWLMMNQMQAPGIALAGSIGMLAQFTVMMSIWTRRYEGGPELKRLLAMLGKILLVSAFGCLLSYALAKWLTAHLPLMRPITLWRLLVVAGSGLPGAAFIFLVLDRMGIAEFRSVLNRVLRRRTTQPIPAKSVSPVS